MTRSYSCALTTRHAHHTSGVAMSASAECGYELLPHSSHSPHLAPSDFCLFPLLKQHLHDTHFSSDNACVGDFLQGQVSQDELYDRTGIEGPKNPREQWK